MSLLVESTPNFVSAERLLANPENHVLIAESADFQLAAGADADAGNDVGLAPLNITVNNTDGNGTDVPLGADAAEGSDGTAMAASATSPAGYVPIRVNGDLKMMPYFNPRNA